MTKSALWKLANRLILLSLICKSRASQPSYDIYSTLVYNTSGDDVVDSIINGKIVMENDQLLTINEPQIFKEVLDISEKFKK